METFRKVIRDNLPHRGMKTCFIHGIGGSIQKTASESNWMSPCPQMQYSVGDPTITIVTIK